MSCNLVYRARNHAKNHRAWARVALAADDWATAERHERAAMWWDTWGTEPPEDPPCPVDSEP